MKRYYVAPVIGSGATPEDAIRLDLPAGVNHVAALDPGLGWGIAVVGAADHSALVASPKLAALASFPLDGKLSALGASVRTTMLNRLQSKFGIVVDTASVDAYRDLIRQIGRRVDPGFDENNFDVNDG